MGRKRKGDREQDAPETPASGAQSQSQITTRLRERPAKKEPPKPVAAAAKAKKNQQVVKVVAEKNQASSNKSKLHPEPISEPKPQIPTQSEQAPPKKSAETKSRAVKEKPGPQETPEGRCCKQRFQSCSQPRRRAKNTCSQR